jgi:hypothetical protein
MTVRIAEMSETEKAKTVTLRDRRRLLRKCLQEYGITLAAFGGKARLTKGMLSLFVSGDRDLSPEAWARVLEAVSKLVSDGPGNLRWDPAKRSAGIAKAKKTAAKLGAAVAQSIHSPTLGERVAKYAFMPPITAGNYTPQELAEIARDVLEIAQIAVHDNAIVRDKEQYWRAGLEKADAKIDRLQDILGLRDKKILTEESEQQKIDALGLERIPPPEEETLRAEIEQRGKSKGETDPLEPSKAQYEKEMREHGFDVRLKRKGKE